MYAGSVLNVSELDPIESQIMVFNIQQDPSKYRWLKGFGRDSKSVAFGRGGSSPPTGTIFR
ncbi:hypothetical protein VCRA2123O444_520005 [Vibrio crassostreae]|nr:hypothetical protein VCRA2119O430_490006 [Vibrio crassostreae]CAK2110113.1 hypothetical protein VCRA2119O431_490007 [Vibrio crassostreae]CAK2131400.1 hypothetical protein VCRA2114O422_520006 [Vibrio crassostreae]CAK2364403.1 hypothetical protein VCRA2116O425_480005 [Vibrio crassostreae]CAK2977452.1 hypothetical protein VCRA2133O453_490006 [Vibrio crassostreae]